ncbi:MAG: M23 family metallopeptidase, partial [Candidatus Hydrogenedentota bacterium]
MKKLKTISLKLNRISFFFTTFLLLDSIFAFDSGFYIGDFKYITGMYGEYRESHLHMGLDFSTDGETKRAIYSPCNGNIVRLKSRKKGDGNALYIKGDDGYLYIFFHLEKFGNDSLNKYLREIGGEDIDLWFKNAIRVNAGEIVGYSGESGSGLPHLHFELRTDFDTTVNPLQLIKIQDK